MGVFTAMNASASGLTAQRLRMDTISENIANANTTRTTNGGPYRRKMVVFQAETAKPFSAYLSEQSKGIIGGDKTGVVVSKVVEDSSPFKKVYDPSNPDADEEGYVEMPNVDILAEMVNMISATRAYEANVTALNSTKGLAMKALDIVR